MQTLFKPKPFGQGPVYLFSDLIGIQRVYFADRLLQLFRVDLRLGAGLLGRIRSAGRSERRRRLFAQFHWREFIIYLIYGSTTGGLSGG